MAPICRPFHAGLAVGIKLNNIAFAAGCIAYSLQLLMEGQHRATLYTLGLPLGFLFANPFLLLHPADIALLLPPHAAPDNYLQHLAYVLSGYYWEWDLVFSGGLIYLSMPLLVWLMLAPCLRPRTETMKAMAPLLAVIGCNLAACVVSARFLGWYLFPAMACLPILICQLLEEKLAESRRCLAYILAVIVLNAAFNIQMVLSQAAVLAQNYSYVWPTGPRAYASSVIHTHWTQLANFYIAREPH